MQILKKILHKLRHPSLLPRTMQLVFANFLNRLATYLLKLSSRFCGQLISYAIHLDPSRELFRKNLTSLGLPSDGIKVNKKSLSFYTVPEGCSLLKQNIRFLTTDKTVQLTCPKVFNPDITLPANLACTIQLPDTYLAEINHADIFPRTDLIISNNCILYDEIDKTTINLYGIKSPVIENVSIHKITIRTPIKANPIKIGIHLTHDHSMNYFHWMIECLPKLSLISDIDTNIPLLIDDDLPEQSYEALMLLNSDKREMIRLKKDHLYVVDKLYYPSRLSVIHDNYNLPIYDKDVVYSTDGIHFVRNTILDKITKNNTKPNRKIYLSRKNSNYRQVLNSIEIENILTERNFEIIFPENLSFFSQVQLFSQASIIIGQSGAGMANLIFAPKTAAVLMLLSDAPGANLQIFNALAQTVDIHLEYLIGQCPIITKKYSLHSDFHVNTTLLLDYLDKNGF